MPKQGEKIALLWVIPTLTHYSYIVSDNLEDSGSIYGIYILTFYLTFFLAYTLTSYLTFYLTFYLASILAFLLAFYLASILTFYLPFSLTWTLRLRSGSAHWHLALEGLRSGSAHWDQLAVEVRQCPLRSGACTMGPGEQLLSVLVSPSTIGWMHLLPEEQAFYNAPRFGSKTSEHIAQCKASIRRPKHLGSLEARLCVWPEVGDDFPKTKRTLELFWAKYIFDHLQGESMFCFPSKWCQAKLRVGVHCWLSQKTLPWIGRGCHPCMRAISTSHK